MSSVAGGKGSKKGKTAAQQQQQQQQHAQDEASVVSSAVSSEELASEARRSDVSDDSSVLSSPSRRGNTRPRFDSKASWADSTRFDMGRAESRASDLSARDLRLTGLSTRNSHRRRSDSRASSRLSRSSVHSGGPRGRQSSFVSNFGVTKARKESNALSTITENWNLADDQFGSPFADFDAQGEVVTVCVGFSL